MLIQQVELIIKDCGIKCKALFVAEKNPNFDGFLDYGAANRTWGEHNQLNNLKKSYQVFNVVLTKAGRLFLVTSSAVIEFRPRDAAQPHLQLHPAELSMWIAHTTETVYTVLMKGGTLLLMDTAQNF